MTSALGSTLTAVARAERSRGLRHLLVRPLTLRAREPEAFATIVRHRDWLARWFADHAGWKLFVDLSGGFARLHKVSVSNLPARSASLVGKPPFDGRRYVLLCLTIAALDETPIQTTLVRITELLIEGSRAESGIPPFDPETYPERRALVDVLRWLEETGLLRLRDGDAERYARDRGGDALYDVDERLLGQLIAAPVPPALAGIAARLCEEPYALSDEGERLRAHHVVVRLLLDDPVIYYEDLSAREFEWLDHSRGFLYRLLEDDLGLVVERRKEGLAAVDREGILSDTLFPDGGSTVKHAALLLAAQLTSRARSTGQWEVSHNEIVSCTRDLMADYAARCNWSKQFTIDESGGAQLAESAMRLLEAFGLVVRQAGSWRLRPALARFTPAAPKAGIG